jgi:hypothetical protein
MRYRPVVEALETRCVPTVLTITSTADSGGGTLRAAITIANNGDTLVFALPKPSTIALKSALDVEKSITVAGPGPSQLTIESTTQVERVFDVGFTNHNAIVTISGLTITGGTGLQGAGLSSMANLTLNNCTVSNNANSSSEGGGGIFNSGTMTIISSQISNNSDNVASGNALAGGIYNSSAGTVMIVGSQISNNTATATSGPVEGGGIKNDGVMTIINSTVANNVASASSGFAGVGGGIDDFAIMTLINSTVSSNQISGSTTDGVGGGINNEGAFNLIGCTVSDNSVGQGTGAGINLDDTASLTDCTIANNFGDVNGGGIDCTFGTISINNSTVAGNYDSIGTGGGIWIGNGVTVNLENTLVANNTHIGFPHLSPDDVFGNPASASNNLIGNGSNTNITNGTSGNIVGVNPMLGPLQNNGGPTQTMALERGSPAIDAGSDALTTTSIDQRGLPRIFGRAVDIGAFESQARPIIVTAAGPGMAPEVKVYDANTGTLLLDFDAYDPHFLGGVRVAVGDVNGDGIPDIITAPGPGGGPDIRVFDGATGARIEEFLAYDPHFQAGVFVAAGDVNGDGKADIITGPDEFSGPDVRVFYAGNVSGKPDKELLAYAQGFTGGVRVAAADLNGDGKADIITAPGPSGSPDIRIFSGATLAKTGEFLAYAVQFTGGVFVAAGDVNGDHVPDIITGAGAGGGPEVRAFDGLGAGMGKPTPTILDDFFAYSPLFSGGVQVAAVALNADGTADIITGAGAGGGPHVRVFDGKTGQQLQHNAVDSFFPFDPSFTGGVFVGGQ